MRALHIDDEEVVDVVENSARVACKALDTVFPGKDRGGITSNFQALLEKVIREMLSGQDPRLMEMSSKVELPALIHTNRTFGDPLTRNDGSGFVVERANDEWLLDWQGTGFVDGHDDEQVDAFTSFNAAVAGAMRYLKANDSSACVEGLSVTLYSSWKADAAGRAERLRNRPETASVE